MTSAQRIEDDGAIKRIVAALRRTDDRRIAELQAFLAADEKAPLAARELMDQLYTTVPSVLCHYATAFDHNGAPHDITDLIQEVQTEMDKVFEKLIGERYETETEREITHRYNTGVDDHAP